MGNKTKAVAAFALSAALALGGTGAAMAADASSCTDGHSYKAVTVKATKCKDGYKGKKCKVCGKVVKTKVLKAKVKHKYKAVTVKAKKCKDGYKGKKCKVCGKVVKTKVLKAKVKHKYKAVNVAATCTEDGYAFKKCKVCGKVTSKKSMPKLGHEYASVTTPAATCGERPVTTSTCARCGDVQVSYGAAREHDWKTVSETKGTCAVAGKVTRKCGTCGKTETVDGEKAAHDWAAATCKAPKTCKVCGATEGSPAAHSYTVTKSAAVEATCTDAGKTAVMKCATCDATIGGAAVPALGHSYSNGKCTRCGTAEPGTHEHAYEWVVTTEPKCTVTGVRSHKCKVCGNVDKTENIAPPGHKMVSTAAVEPTCTAAGHKAKEQCSVCGAVTGGEEVAALGHDWAEATCTAAKACKRCGEKQGEALGHDWKVVSETAATCTADGKTVSKCARCGEDRAETTPAKGHAWHTADCTEGTICSACGAVQEGSVKSEHTWGADTVIQEGTCQTKYIARHKCTLCDVEENIEYFGEHVYEDQGCERGIRCKVCGDLKEGSVPGQHEWVEASRTKGDCKHYTQVTYTCSKCNSTKSEQDTAAGYGEHEWTPATCTAPKTCTICGATEGEATGHSWVDATCYMPRHCSVCNSSEGELAEHELGEWVHVYDEDEEAEYWTRKCKNFDICNYLEMVFEDPTK